MDEWDYDDLPPRRRWPRGTRVIALVMLACLIGVPVLSLIIRLAG